jgi:GGDEF domain-containing protein
VYLSILSVLAKESETPGVQAISTKIAAEPKSTQKPGISAKAPALAPPWEAPPVRAFSTTIASRVAPKPAPPRESLGESLRDPVTGAGNWESLRRDVITETINPKYRAPSVLVSFSVEPLEDIRRRMGSMVADDVLRTLVEVMWAMFTDDDRVYRSGEKEITVVVRNGDAFMADRTLSKLDKSVRMGLTRRRLPTVRLTMTASPAAMAAFDVTGLGAVL